MIVGWKSFLYGVYLIEGITRKQEVTNEKGFDTACLIEVKNNTKMFGSRTDITEFHLLCVPFFIDVCEQTY